MFVFSGVDGTGEDSNSSYETTFRNSFVNRYLSQRAEFAGHSFYVRGPRLAGTETHDRAARAVSKTKENVAKFLGNNAGRMPAVILAGYSRGCASILQAANRLHESGIPVELIILFDAVNRTSDIPYRDTMIPASTRRCVQYRRDQAANSRVHFGYCATPRADPASTQYMETHVFGTHGAMGGTPWGPESVNEDGFIDEYYQEREGYAPGSGDWSPGVIAPTRVTLPQEARAVSQVLTSFQSVLDNTIQRVRQDWNAGGDRNPETGGPTVGTPWRDTPHVVQRGESLSVISRRYYGDMLLFPLIYDANASVIGPNWNMIQPNMALRIPDKASFSAQQMDTARRRARSG